MEECRALLQSHAETNPKTATLVKLTLAQLQLNEGDRLAAIKALESIDGAYKLMGVVGSIVRLAEGSKDSERVIQTLELALAAAQADGAAGKDLIRKLVQLTAEHHSKNADPKKAVQVTVPSRRLLDGARCWLVVS